MLRRGLSEADEAGNAGGDVQRLLLLAEWNRGELITKAEVEGQPGGDAEIVVSVDIDRGLIAIEGGADSRRRGVALSNLVRADVVEVAAESGVLVVATETLHEDLRRNVFASFDAKVEGVLSFDPGKSVDCVVETLNGGLRGVGVGAKGGGGGEVVEVEAWELIEAGERNVRNRSLAEEAGVTDTKLVAEIRREGMNLGCGEKVITTRGGDKNAGKLAAVSFPSRRL